MILTSVHVGNNMCHSILMNRNVFLGISLRVRYVHIIRVCNIIMVGYLCKRIRTELNCHIFFSVNWLKMAIMVIFITHYVSSLFRQKKKRKEKKKGICIEISLCCIETIFIPDHAENETLIWVVLLLASKQWNIHRYHDNFNKRTYTDVHVWDRDKWNGVCMCEDSHTPAQTSIIVSFN